MIITWGRCVRGEEGADAVRRAAQGSGGVLQDGGSGAEDGGGHVLFSVMSGLLPSITRPPVTPVRRGHRRRDDVVGPITAARMSHETRD